MKLRIDVPTGNNHGRSHGIYHCALEETLNYIGVDSKKVLGLKF